MADITPEEMARRIRIMGERLSVTGMNASCQAGLRPTRAYVKRRNFGFLDRTGATRRAITIVRRYKRSTVRRNGPGAFFRGRLLVAIFQYGARRRLRGEIRARRILTRAQRSTRAASLRAFVTRGRQELTKAVVRARTGRR